jgi:hypothetical protein
MMSSQLVHIHIHIHVRVRQRPADVAGVVVVEPDGDSLAA